MNLFLGRAFFHFVTIWNVDLLNVSAVDRTKLSQITCTSVQRSLPGYVKDDVKGPASAIWGKEEWKGLYPKLQASVIESVKAAAPRLHKLSEPAAGITSPAGQAAPAVVAASHFGYDYLVTEDADGGYSPVLIEVNQAPQVGDPQSMASLRQSVGVPMINGIVDVLLSGGKKGSGYGGGWDWVGDLPERTLAKAEAAAPAKAAAAATEAAPLTPRPAVSSDLVETPEEEAARLAAYEEAKAKKKAAGKEFAFAAKKRDKAMKGNEMVNKNRKGGDGAAPPTVSDSDATCWSCFCVLGLRFGGDQICIAGHEEECGDGQAGGLPQRSPRG